MIRYSPAILVTSPRRPFDFTGRHAVIDFINTVDGRPSFTRDDLASPEDLFEWASAAGLLVGEPKVSCTVDDAKHFAAAKMLREDLYDVFGPIARGASPGTAAIQAVAARASLATRSAEWVGRGSSFEPQWPGNSLESICDQLADAAVVLLRSSSLARVGSCAGCGWLFLDTSRGHARRWCSMNVCGVRDKMRRYHQRQSNATSMA